MDFKKETHTYKRANGLELLADVYFLEGRKKCPAILWLHGGGFIFGNREMISQKQLDMYLKLGFAVIAIDYRLAPETKLNEIIQDAHDALSWLKVVDSFNIDPTCISAVGHSAGGYLALSLGGKVKNIVSFYGYGDVNEAWCSTESEYYKQMPSVSSKMAFSGVGKGKLSSSVFGGFEDPRWLFYLHCRQNGIWVKEVMGEERVKIEYNSDFSPTMLLHGDQDTDVPHDASMQIASLLEKKQVSCQMITLEGKGHLFDNRSDAQVRKAFFHVLAFLKGDKV